MKQRLCAALRRAPLIAALGAILGGFAPAGAFATAGRSIDFDDFFAMRRIGRFEISPDGKWIAFELTSFDTEANSSNMDIWLVSTSGGDAVPGTELPSEGQPAESTTQPGQPASAKPSSRPAEESPFEIVPDDGKQPWQSPTAGRAVSLRYLPPGAQVFLIARPADLLASPEGPRVLQALGASFAGTQAAWEAAAGVPLSEMAQLIVSFQDRGDPLPRPTLVVRPKTPVTKESLAQKLGGAGAGQASPNPDIWLY